MRASRGPVPRLALFPYPAPSPLVPTGVASSQPPADDEKDLRAWLLVRSKCRAQGSVLCSPDKYRLNPRSVPGPRKGPGVWNESHQLCL